MSIQKLSQELLKLIANADRLRRTQVTDVDDLLAKVEQCNALLTQQAPLEQSSFFIPLEPRYFEFLTKVEYHPEHLTLTLMGKVPLFLPTTSCLTLDTTFDYLTGDALCNRCDDLVSATQHGFTSYYEYAGRAFFQVKGSSLWQYAVGLQKSLVEHPDDVSEQCTIYPKYSSHIVNFLKLGLYPDRQFVDALTFPSRKSIRYSTVDIQDLKALYQTVLKYTPPYHVDFKGGGFEEYVTFEITPMESVTLGVNENNMMRYISSTHVLDTSLRHTVHRLWTPYIKQTPFLNSEL